MKKMQEAVNSLKDKFPISELVKSKEKQEELDNKIKEYKKNNTKNIPGHKPIVTPHSLKLAETLKETYLRINYNKKNLAKQAKSIQSELNKQEQELKEKLAKLDKN